MQVLVVDDDAEIRDLCRVNLEFAGHDVTVAGSGRDALARLEERVPDIVFLDLSMPEIDGWDVLHEIRNRPETAHVPVVLLTARAGEDDEIRAFESGVFDYVVKPFNPSSLEQWVEEARLATGGDGEGRAAAEERRRRRIEQLEFLRRLR